MTIARENTIDLPDAPDVPGLRFRRFRGPDDYAAMTVVGNASRLAAGAEGPESLAGAVEAVRDALSPAAHEALGYAEVTRTFRKEL